MELFCFHNTACFERSSSMTDSVPLSVHTVSTVLLVVKLSGNSSSLNTSTHQPVWLLVQEEQGQKSACCKCCFMYFLWTNAPYKVGIIPVHSILIWDGIFKLYWMNTGPGNQQWEGIDGKQARLGGLRTVSATARWTNKSVTAGLKLQSLKTLNFTVYCLLFTIVKFYYYHNAADEREPT